MKVWLTCPVKTASIPPNLASTDSFTPILSFLRILVILESRDSLENAPTEDLYGNDDLRHAKVKAKS